MKIKKIVAIVLLVLAAGIAVMSGIMKLMGSAQGIKMLDQVGVAQYRVVLGIAEIVFAGLFAFPRTMKIGFILLSSYFAGALAVELSHHLTLNAIIPLVFVWLAAFAVNPSIFLSKADNN